MRPGDVVAWAMQRTQPPCGAVSCIQLFGQRDYVPSSPTRDRGFSSFAMLITTATVVDDDTTSLQMVLSRRHVDGAATFKLKDRFPFHDCLEVLEQKVGR